MTRMVAMVLCVMVSLGLVGCGNDNSPEARAWQAAEGLEVQILMEMPYGRGSEAEMRNVHEQAAGTIDGVLERFPEAPAELRDALTQLRDREQTLASGEASGDEAEQLRQQQADALSQLAEGELPGG